MNELERTYLLERLERLGAEDDAEALQAARELAARVSEGELDWDDLIAPEDPPDGDFAAADFDPEEDEGDGAEEEPRWRATARPRCSFSRVCWSAGATRGP